MLADETPPMVPSLHGDDAGHRLGEAEVVGDDDDGGAVLLVDLEEEVVHRVAGLGVEVAGGLVGEEELGREDQGAGEGDALLLAAGELAGAVGDAVAQGDLVEQGAGGALHLAAALALDEAGHHHVLEGVELGEQVVELEDEADGPVADRRQPGAGEAGELVVAEADGAARGQVEGADAVEQGALAGARGADDGHHLALVDGDVDAPEHPQRAPHVHEALVQIAHLDEASAHGLALYSQRRPSTGRSSEAAKAG